MSCSKREGRDIETGNNATLFFPYIGYWQLIHAVDKYVIYDDVNFIKGGWINRNNLLLNGERKLINLRMYGASPNKLINEIEVLDDSIYRNKLLKSIEIGYNKAPFFQMLILRLRRS